MSLAVLLAGLVWTSAIDPNRADTISNSQGIPPAVTSSSNPAQLALAKHLRASDAVMYSAYWCPHCHDQKELFGKQASKELRIIECAEDGRDSQRSLCERKAITGYPSWEINGRLDSGVLSLEDLAELSKYKGSKDF